MAQLLSAPELGLGGEIAPDASGFAGAASHAYAAGLQFATALKDQALRGQQQKQQAANEQTIANQQATNQKQKADSEYALEVDRLNKTGRPLTQAEISGQNSGVPQAQELPPAEDAAPGTTSGGYATNPSAQPTFQNGAGGMTPAPTQQPINPKNIQYDSRMQPWFVNSPEQMEGMKQQPGLPVSGQFLDSMRKMGLNPRADGTIPASDAATLAKALGVAYQEPETETLDKDHYSDASGNPATVATGSRTGTQKVVKPPDGLTQNPQASKADSQKLIPGWYGKTGKPMIVNPKTGKAVEMDMEDGAKPGLTAEQQEVAGRIAIARQESQARISERQQDRVDAKAKENQQKADTAITKYQTLEQSQHDLRKQYGDALSTEPDADGQNKGQTFVIDPVTKKEVELTAARRISYQNELNKATANAQNYHEAQRKIVAAQGGTPAPPLDLGPAATPLAATPAPVAAPSLIDRAKSAVGLGGGTPAPAASPAVTPRPVTPPPVTPSAVTPPAAPPSQKAAAPAAPPAPAPKALANWNRLAAPAAAAAPKAPPKTGDVVKGYKFKGGDPADKNNWAKAGQ